jgi:hypothetical protein
MSALGQSKRHAMLNIKAGYKANLGVCLDMEKVLLAILAPAKLDPAAKEMATS